jgi:hypothetical protein
VEQPDSWSFGQIDKTFTIAKLLKLQKKVHIKLVKAQRWYFGHFNVDFSQQEICVSEDYAIHEQRKPPCRL